MNLVHRPPTILSEDSLDRICGGMYPFRPQVGPAYDHSVNPGAMGAYMGAGALTGGLGGMAMGGVGAVPGAVGGALLGGIGCTTERILNPSQVLPAMPLAVCHGTGPTPPPMAMAPCHRQR